MTEVSAPVAAAPEASEPTPNMTGEQAKAWVEAQKGKPAPSAGPGREAPKASSQDAVKEAAAEARRKIKIDDQEIDEEEIIKTYKERKGHQQAANKRLQEGNAARKQAEEFLSMMRDPEKFFEVAKKIGHDPRNLTEKFLASQLEEELLDPREKEFRQTKKELEAIKAEKAREESERQEKINNALRDKYRQDFETSFVSALQETKLPPTKRSVAAMAKYVHDAAQIGFEMTPIEAARLVKEDIENFTKSLFSEADGDMLVSILGEESANKLRKWDTSRLKNPESYLRTPAEQPDPSQIKQRGTPKKRMTAAEWRDFNRK